MSLIIIIYITTVSERVNFNKLRYLIMWVYHIEITLSKVRVYENIYTYNQIIELYILLQYIL